MALILPVKGIEPDIGKACFIAPNATLIGDLVIRDHCSVWFNAVIRADVNKIRIGEYSNVQDGAIIHCTYRKTATHIGNFVSIGHNALVHGCEIKDNVLVGMGSIVMDYSVVESFVIIGAGAVVLENTHCESGYLYAGVPARKVKPLTEEQVEMLKTLPHNYVRYSNWFQTE